MKDETNTTSISIFSSDVTVEELQFIIDNNTLPSHFTLDGIAERKDFDKLFKHRTNPKFIASQLLKERGDNSPSSLSPSIHKVMYESSEGQDFKERRLKIKELELQHKIAKTESLTFQLQHIWKALSRIEDKLDVVLAIHTSQKEEVKDNGRSKEV